MSIPCRSSDVLSTSISCNNLLALFVSGSRVEWALLDLNFIDVLLRRACMIAELFPGKKSAQYGLRFQPVDVAKSL